MNTEWVTLEQGSQEWLDYRQTRFNASEAGAVMGVNPWFPKNPAELWDLKNGVREVVMNSSMQRGIDLEPQARAYAENILKDDLTPQVAQRGRYSASLDGINFDGTVAVEIKCPSSDTSKLWECVTPNQIRVQAPNYWWQLVHQFYVVTSLQRIALVVWSYDRIVMTMVNRDEVVGHFDALCSAWERFGEALDSKTRPEQEDLDDSEEFQQLVHAYKVEKLKLEAAEKSLKVVEEEIKGYAKRTGKTSLKGFGASVTQVTRQGSVDYAKVPELKGVDLEPYRKKPSTYWMVKV